MDLEYAILGLIRMHQGVSGYELNQMIKVSTGDFLSASLSHIYPALKRLHDQGLVSYDNIPLKNRPTKKVYKITEQGEAILNAWLEEPAESSLDFKAFCLKLAFSPLMKKETILFHVDREIAYREGLRTQRKRGRFIEINDVNREKINLTRAELLWNSIHLVHLQTEELRLAWLKEFRQSVETVLKM
jgi:DNA-binding PadR family transcriptional regulator